MEKTEKTDNLDDLFRISFQNDCMFIDKKHFDTFDNTCENLEKELLIEKIKENYTIEVIFYNKTGQILDENNFDVLKDKENIIELLIKPDDQKLDHSQEQWYFVGNSQETPYIWHYYDNSLSVTLYNNSKDTFKGILVSDCEIKTEADYSFSLTPKEKTELSIKFSFDSLQKLKDDTKEFAFCLKKTTGSTSKIPVKLHVKIV